MGISLALNLLNGGWVGMLPWCCKVALARQYEFKLWRDSTVTIQRFPFDINPELYVNINSEIISVLTSSAFEESRHTLILSGLYARFISCRFTAQ